MRRLKYEEVPILIRQLSESDISEELSELERRDSSGTSLIDALDKLPAKTLRMEVNLKSERRESDFFVYQKKVAGNLKISEHLLVFSRKKLGKEDVKVEAVPLKLPNRLIYFEFESKFS